MITYTVTCSSIGCDPVVNTYRSLPPARERAAEHVDIAAQNLASEPKVLEDYGFTGAFESALAADPLVGFPYRIRLMDDTLIEIVITEES